MISRWFAVGICICLGLFAFVPGAGAKQLAVVVGNNAYQEVPQLVAAVNDARAMTDGLKRAGFSVELVENGTKLQISRALATVEGEIDPGDTVVFHFSGHGFEIDGQNWLLPVDVPAAKQGESGLIKDQSFNAADIIDRFRAKGAGTVVAILDACRDNPFASTGTRGLPGTRGLARMEAPGGVFIIFSAGTKQEALDNLGQGDAERTSVFVRSFLPLIGRSDMSLIDMAKETQQRVQALARSIGRDQVPAYYDGIVGRVGLAGAVVAANSVPKPDAAPAAPASRSSGSEDLFWSSIKDGSDPAVFQAYLDQVQSGAFVGTYKALAMIKLAALQPKPVPPPGAEASSPEIEACDRAAASPLDKDKPANMPGVEDSVMAPQAAILACQKAAEVPNVPRRVFYELGRAYEKTGNYHEAYPNYLKAAQLKHLLGMHNLARMYVFGYGVGKDPSLAREIFEEAANAGDTRSFTAIGDMYEGKVGIPRDYGKSLLYFQKAVDAGDYAAYNDLASLYFNGWGVPRDPRKACDLYRQGAGFGEATAISNAKRLCRGHL